MPVATGSRYDQQLSPPQMTTTPSRSSYLRMPTNNTNYAPTVISTGGQPKLNVVTRVAIEGKAKRGQEGASVRMFLKICLPVDSVTPGSTIPLFPEENVKIYASQVHPLDQNGVPYNFSSTVSPLLHNAARALSLPLRSQENFNATFGLVKSNIASNSSRSLRSENEENIPPIDAQYTGHILVSGYSISFVTPKVFLSRKGNSSDTEEGIPKTPAHRRRHSINERDQIFFMAAIDMWVPFLSKPPRSPYILSIPTPRCLHNHIKLRIFPPPSNASASFASLSSVEEDIPAWDLTSEPHVARSGTSRSSRSHSRQHFVDDESSDSSTPNTTDGCVIQGTFPSAEHIKIRWAKPIKFVPVAENDNGRRRVGVEDARGEMVYSVRGKGVSANNPEVEGIVVNIEYQGHCNGIWFPGVATLLGLDISLETKGCDVNWAQGYPNHWKVSGSEGYTGFDHGSSLSPATSGSRASSLEPSGNPPPSSIAQDSTTLPFLSGSGSSMSSLLRAPLPVQNVADYSFEGSNLTLSPGTTSSMTSLTAPSMPSLPQPPQIHPPGTPVTLHLDMNELQPLTKNNFNLRISGTVLLSARDTIARAYGPNGSNTSTSIKPGEQDPVFLPRFTVLAADSESTQTTIRNDSELALVEVFNSNGDVHRDPQTRKTILQKNGFTRCGEDGCRISLKFPTDNYKSSNGYGATKSPNRPPINSNHLGHIPYNSNLSHTGNSKRDGLVIIPWVKANVTTLAPDVNVYPTGYVVNVTLPTPTGLESEWLEFGIAQISPTNDQDLPSPTTTLCTVHVICASIDGIPVRAETTDTAKAASDGLTGVAQFENIGGKVWVCWGRVYIGSSTSGTVTIDYLVKDRDLESEKGTKSLTESSALNVLLPTFVVSVARLEVFVDAIPGLEIGSLRSNFDYHYSSPNGNRLCRFFLDGYSQSQLSLTIRKQFTRHSIFGSHSKWFFVLSCAMFFMSVFLIFCAIIDTRSPYANHDTHTRPYEVNRLTHVPTITITTTILESTVKWPDCPPTAFSIFTSEDITTGTTMTSTTTSLSTFPLIPTTTTEPSFQDQYTDETSLTHTTLLSILDRFGLISFERFFPSWEDDQADVLSRMSQKVVTSAEVVWNICRKVYHYPLDPP